MPATETIALFEHLRAKHNGKERVRIQLAPSNQQWCTDEGLAMLADSAEKHGVPIHMHLVETPYQKEYARRRGHGGTAVDYIERFGLLGPQTTLGHAVWLSEGDLDKLAETHTSVCHNCSSNFRLRSGVLPLNRLEARGINTAIGLDDVGINDDQDMLQEMRMVLRAHREPGMDDRVPTMAQVFRMATSGGARTTPYAAEIGTLEVGKAADMVLIDWKQISYPYLDSETPVLDAVIQRAKMAGVRTVIVAARSSIRTASLPASIATTRCASSPTSSSARSADDEIERQRLSKAVLPHVKSFYDGYCDLDGARALLPAELAGLGVMRARLRRQRHEFDISAGTGGKRVILDHSRQACHHAGARSSSLGADRRRRRACSATGSSSRSARLRS